MSAWSNAYVGIPYNRIGASREGANCWTLVALVYREQLGIVLPSYLDDYVSMEESAEISGLVGAERGKPVWVQLHGASPDAFDIVLFRRGRVDAHVGVVVEPGLMLHVTGDEQSKIERYETPVWGRRLIGAFRHIHTVSRAAQ